MLLLHIKANRLIFLFGVILPSFVQTSDISGRLTGLGEGRPQAGNALKQLLKQSGPINYVPCGN